MHWKLKAAAFRLLELPGGSQLHYLLQRYVTRTWPRPDWYVDALWNRAGQLVAIYKARVGFLPKTVLEIGAGRDLTIPLALRCHGVERVISTDVNRLAKLSLLQHVAQRKGVTGLGSWADLKAFGIDYRAPQRAEDCLDVLGEVDCVCSNQVLEHIPRPDLLAMISGTKQLLRRGGLAIHAIDYSDHYVHFDRSIGRLNFLQYSDRQWAPFNRDRQFVNRLRHSDYIRAFAEAGYAILAEESTPENPSDAVRCNLADQFKRYEERDLYAVRGQIIAQA